MPPRVVVDFDVVVSKAALVVGQSAVDQLFELLNVERFEAKNLRARYECTVHIKEWIVRGRTDKAKFSRFDIGQKDVLLRLIEMMNLIDEQNGLFPRCAETVRSRGKDTAHLSDVAFNPANPNKFRMSHFRNDTRQRGFAASGRAVKNYRWQAIGFDRAAQKFARRENVFLADKFLQRSRPHPGGERRSDICDFNVLVFLE